MQSRTRDFSDRREHERRQSATIEITLRRPAPRHTWLAGIASDWFANRTPATPLPSAYVYTGPSIFFHDEMQVASWLTASGSVRLDYHVSDGPFAESAGFGARARRAVGGADFGRPELLLAEGAHRGDGSGGPDAPDDRQRWRSRAGNREQRVGRPDAHDADTPSSRSRCFERRSNNPALVDRATYTLRTESDPVVTRGVEILGTARRPPFAVTGTYAYLRARERGDLEVALTPRHSASVIATVEADGRGRIGVQVHFTGEQRLDANPYRSTSESYTVVNLLGRTAVRPLAPVRQRGEPDGCPPDELGSDRASGA